MAGGKKGLSAANLKKLRDDPTCCVDAWIKQKNLCRRCGADDHHVKDCPVPRNASERSEEHKALVKVMDEKRRAIKAKWQKRKKELLASQ